MTGARPIRTILNVPGDRIEQVRAAASFGSDAVWIDLEEPRTPLPEEERAQMRREVREFLLSVDPGADGPSYLVRVQPVDSAQLLKDLEAVACPALTGIVLPKVYRAADVSAAAALLGAVEADLGLPDGRFVIYPILETAEALRSVHAIASASPRVAYLGGAVSRFGDIVQALNYRWTASGEETLIFRSLALLDLRAVPGVHGITGNWGGALDDLEGVRAWARQGRDLGYRGTMTAYGPHVPLYNREYGMDVGPAAGIAGDPRQ